MSATSSIPGMLAARRRRTGKSLRTQRFAAREPQFANARRRRSPDHPLDFVKRQDVRPGLAAVRDIRHAVKATNVAPIRDADPQAVVNASVPVYEVGPGEDGQCRLHYPQGCKLGANSAILRLVHG